MEGEKVVAEADELPKAIVRRVVKNKLSECSPDYDVSVHKEAILAFAESARIFIHYLSATANDICKESRRQTINANDVLKALEDIDFPEFIEPLEASLEEYKRKNPGKKGGGPKPTDTNKRKAEESAQKSRGKSKQTEENEKNEDEDEPDKDEDDDAGDE